MIFLFLLLLDYIYALIQPRSFKPIELSINNINEIADYTFHFYLDAQIKQNQFIHIRFPRHNYDLTQYANFECLLKYKNQTEFVKCEYKQDNEIIFHLNKKVFDQQMLISLTVNQIQNPSDQNGTGNFIIKFIQGESNLLDYNFNFGQVAFTKQPLTLSDLQIQLTNGQNKTGQFSDWDFNIQLNNSQQTLEKNDRIVITLEKTLLVNQITNVKVDFTDKINVNYQENSIIVEFQEKFQNQGQFTISVLQLQNIYYSTTIGQITVRLFQKHTFSILQQKVVNSNLSIDPFILLNEKINIKMLNRSQTYQKDQSYEFEYSFYSPFYVPQKGLIELNLGQNIIGKSCWVQPEIDSLSETEIVSCNIDSNIIQIKNFGTIIESQLIIIMVYAQTASSYLTISDQKIEIYQDEQKLKKMIESENFGPVLSNDIKNFDVFDYQETQDQIEFSFQIDTTIQSNNINYIEIVFDKSYYFITEMLIEFYEGVQIQQSPQFTVVPDHKQIILSIDIDQFTITQNTDYKIVLKKTICLKNLTQQYQVNVQSIVFTLMSSLKDKYQSVIIEESQTANNNFQIDQVIVDVNESSIYKFKLKLPFDLQDSLIQNYDSGNQSAIYVLFELDQSSNDCFQQDLGLNLNDKQFLPCYGLDIFQNKDEKNKNFLQCQILFNYDSNTNLTAIKISNYTKLLKNDELIFYLPNIKNPNNENFQCSVKLQIYQQNKGLNTKIFDSQHSLNLSKEVNIYNNKKNTDGVLDSSTLDGVQYYPNQIGLKSYFEIKLLPERQLQKDNGLLIKVPSLPQTNNQDYLLSKYDESYCEMNNVKAECHSFAESNLLLLYFPDELTFGIEQTFRIYNVTNPSYVSNFQEGMIVWTFDVTTMLAVENFEFPPLDPFNYGDILYSKVRPSSYEAENVYIDYEWVFIISNPIPKGGYITAYFPPNYYNLEESDPCPEIQLKYGLSWIDEQNNPNIKKQQCTDLYKTSTATITDINEVQMQQQFNTTMLVINFEGVKNPSQENWTPYFGISTHNEAGYIIDRKLDIQPILIERKLNAGQINFLKFESIPNNGNLLSTYYLEFEIQTSIPKNGQIKIEFPQTEFSVGFSQSQICKIIEPVTTFQSCTFDGNKPIVIIQLDEEITVLFEYLKFSLQFPDIMNFNADLKSDVVKVTTLYDSIALDMSSQEDVNRRAQTVQQASLIQNISLEQTIKNESSFTDLKIKFDLDNIETIDRIEISFPQQFGLLLGNQMHCDSQAFIYGQYDKVYCEVEERIIKVYNLKPQNNCPCQVDLQIYNVLLPNYEYNNQIDNISLYIYKTEKTVTQYTYSIGQIYLIQNALPIVDIEYQYYSLEPATKTQLDFDIYFKDSFSYDQLKLFTRKDMYLDFYNLDIALKIDNQVQQIISKFDRIEFDSESLKNITQNQNQKINLNDFFSGFDYKIRSIPELQYIHKAQFQIISKSYENLVKNQVQDIQIQKQLLQYENEKIKLHEGTYTEPIQINSFYKIENQEQPVPRLYDDYIKFDLDNIQWTERNMYFRVASPLHEKSKQTYIALDFKEYFYPLPPIKIKVFHNVKNDIQVEDVDGVATGGFSYPLYVSIQYAPFYQLEVILYALNTKNEILSINPSKLVFQPGVNKNAFYIYSHYSSKNSELSFAFTKKESEGDTYQFKNGITQKKVKIIEGEFVKPQLLDIKVHFQSYRLQKNDFQSQENQQQQDTQNQQDVQIEQQDIQNQQDVQTEQQIDISTTQDTQTQQQTAQDTQKQQQAAQDTQNQQQIDQQIISDTQANQQVVQDVQDQQQTPQEQQDVNQIQNNQTDADQQQQQETDIKIVQEQQTQQNDLGNDTQYPFQNFEFPNEETVQAKIHMEFDTPVVLHYCVYTRGTLDITLEEIINKKLNYINYDEPIIFGTYLSKDQQQFEYTIDNISINKDLTLKIFPINRQGQIGEAIFYDFSTINYNDPLVVYLQVSEDGISNQDSVKSSLANFLGIQDTEISQDYNADVINNFIENIKVSQSEFYFSNNSFVPKDENDENFKIEYKSQIQNDNKYIQITQNDVVIEFNYMKKQTKKIQNNENFGYNVNQYIEKQNQQKVLQSQKLYQQEEGYKFDFSYQIFQQQYTQQQFRQDSLLFNTPPSQSFLRYIIYPKKIPSLSIKNILHFRKFELMDSQMFIENIYYANMKKKYLKWGQENHPMIQQITTSSITISNIQVLQPCNILYTVNPSIRVTFINKIQPPSLNLLFDKSKDTYERKCLQNSMNNMEVKCFRENNDFIQQLENQYDIYDARNITKIAHLPTNEQIKNGLDPYNIKSIQSNKQAIKTENENNELQINNLKPNTNYTIFMTLQNDENLYLQEDQIIYFVFQTKGEIIEEFILILQKIILMYLLF